MFCIAVGQPIGFSDCDAFDFDAWDRTIITTHADFCFWHDSVEYIMSDLSDEDGAKALTLFEARLLAAADTEQELFEAIEVLRPIRQGLAWYKDGNNCVLMGKEKNYTLPMLQYAVWKCADGKLNLRQIFDMLIPSLMDFPNVTREVAFTQAVATLVDERLIFLR